MELRAIYGDLENLEHLKLKCLPSFNIKDLSSLSYVSYIVFEIGLVNE